MLLKVITFILVIYCVFSILRKVGRYFLFKIGKNIMDQHFHQERPKKEGMHIDHIPKHKNKINDSDAETIDFEEVE
tara:strand:- start:93 stop:320 length:228 start_codon:yes stop_codon:yes gene_type:complete